MTPTPRERVEKALIEGRLHGDVYEYSHYFIETMENVVLSAISDQTAALQAALEDLEKANTRIGRLEMELTASRAGHRTTQGCYETELSARKVAERERDGLAAALTLLMNPHAERLNGYYRGKEWREYDDMRGSHYLANPWLSIGEVVTLLNAKRDAASIVAAHDRAVAARVLRALGSTVMDILDWEAVRRIAAQYEAGERGVPNV